MKGGGNPQSKIPEHRKNSQKLPPTINPEVRRDPPKSDPPISEKCVGKIGAERPEMKRRNQPQPQAELRTKPGCEPN